MRFRHRDTVNGCVGALDIPTTAGRVTVTAVGEDRADALSKASLIAERIASDPIMAALMPPQAQAAIAAAKGLAAAAKRGTRTLRHFWHRIRGPGKRRLAEVLHAEAAAKEGEGEPSTGDVGWNPFRRKRSKPKRRARAQRREPEPEEPEDEEPEAVEAQAEQQAIADAQPVGDDEVTP